MKASGWKAENMNPGRTVLRTPIRVTTPNKGRAKPSRHVRRGYAARAFSEGFRLCRCRGIGPRAPEDINVIILAGNTRQEGWLRGLDLNQRPLGYEPNKSMARLCLSMTYVDLVLPFSAHLRGVLFSICSQSVLRVVLRAPGMGLRSPCQLYFGVAYSWRLGGCCRLPVGLGIAGGGHLNLAAPGEAHRPPLSFSVPSAAHPGAILTC